MIDFHSEEILHINTDMCIINGLWMYPITNNIKSALRVWLSIMSDRYKSAGDAQ